MGKLIVVQDGSTFNCDLNITTTNYSSNSFYPMKTDISFSIPYTNTNYQIINNHFKPIFSQQGLVSNYKKDVIYIVDDCSGFKLMGFYVTTLGVSDDFHGNQYIDVEGQCDYYNHEINIMDNEYKRKMRKKKLERILQ